MGNNVVDFPLKKNLVDAVEQLIEEGFPKIKAVSIVMGAFTEDHIKNENLTIPVEDFGVAWLSLYNEFLKK